MEAVSASRRAPDGEEMAASVHPSSHVAAGRHLAKSIPHSVAGIPYLVSVDRAAPSSNSRDDIASASGIVRISYDTGTS